MSKLSIKNPKNGHSNVQCAPMSLCSLDFGRPQPFMMIDTVPSGKYNATGSALVRVTPQVFPPFGRLSLKHATFFVPENLLYQGSTAFHNDQKTFQGKNVVHPWFYSTQLNSLFGLLSTQLSEVATSNNYDFACLNPNWSVSNPIVYRTLTTRGRKAFSIIKSLGYDFVTYSTIATGETAESFRARHEFQVNAYPLLAYMKIITDKFMNAQYYEQSPAVSLLNDVYSSRTQPLYLSTNGHLFSEGLESSWINIFSNFGVMFESNLYNTAWNTVNSPTGSSPSTSLYDGFESGNYFPSIISPVSSGNENGELGGIYTGAVTTTHADTVNEYGLAQYSAYGHKMLMAVDKFIRRKGLVGTRAAQQFYAMFGIKGSDWSRNMVTLIDTGSQRLTFNAITSTADTLQGSGSSQTGSPLGQFAGQGIGGLNISYNYQSDTFGYIISICWLNIDPIKQRGFNPTCLRQKYLDYWRSHFEGQYNRPIPDCELTGGKAYAIASPKHVFGFIPLYEEYKTVQDNVSGAFIDNTTERFAFMRDYTKEQTINSSVLLAQNNALTTWYATRGNPSITNPFLFDSSKGDRFWFCVDWKMNLSLPLMSKEDTLGIDGAGDLEIEEINGALK